MAELINSDDNLLRRVVFQNPSFVRPDQTLTSFAFTPRKIAGGAEKLSVDIERLTTHAKSIRDRYTYRLYALTAEQVRQIGLDCEHDPLPDNEAHALIVGTVTNSKAKQLAAFARRVPFPD
ncbi:MAG: hypothetical protein ACOYXA_15240 [Bacteroidota bacterium]